MFLFNPNELSKLILLLLSVTGRIVLRSAGMFHHYEGQPDEDTQRKMLDGGFYDTGDAGCQVRDTMLNNKVN